MTGLFLVFTNRKEKDDFFRILNNVVPAILSTVEVAHNIFHVRLDLPQAEYFRCTSGARSSKDSTSSCAIAVVAHSRGNQHSL